jgi:hypothetical protein
MEEWKNGITLFNLYPSNIPISHYPNITFYINFASSRQQKRSNSRTGEVEKEY